MSETHATPVDSYEPGFYEFLFYNAASVTSLVLGDQAGNKRALPARKLIGSGAGCNALRDQRRQESNIAMLALTCRIIEAVHSESAIFFVVGSALFSWLLLRGRMIPVALAWRVCYGSLVVFLPL